MSADRWYDFRVSISGDSAWEKQVIGYVDPLLSAEDRSVARARLEREILSKLNYVGISIRTATTTEEVPSFRVVTFYIDGLRLIDGR
jgi:hypothetical protein